MRLDDDTFVIFAGKFYDMKQAASEEEFSEDLKRFQYLKRLFKRYEDDKELKTRLILNHLIVLYNCFGKNASVLLFFKLKEYHSYLKPFVLFLNFLPHYVEYEDEIIFTEDIYMDPYIVKELKKI